MSPLKHLTSEWLGLLLINVLGQLESLSKATSVTCTQPSIFNINWALDHLIGLIC